MSGISVGDQPIKRAFVGTTPVRSIWVGDTKVWPVLDRRRATSLHNGAITDRAPGTTVTLWDSDPGHPATVSAGGSSWLGRGSSRYRQSSRCLERRMSTR